MPELNFTKTSIDAIPAPAPGQRVVYHDVKDKGFVLRVSAKDRVYYLYRWSQKDQKPIWVKIGSWKAITPEQARKRFREMAAEVELGGDPGEVRRADRSEKTFAELFTWYEKHHAARKKTGWRDAQQFKLYMGGLARMKLSAITRAHVRELHAEVGERAPYAANRMLALIRSIFNRATECDEFNGANPAIGVKPFPEKSRDRRLMEGELAAFLAGVEAEKNADIKDYVYLSLFTGQRKANVLAMRWDQIDTAHGIWRIPETKNGLPLDVPLGAPELAILAERRKAADGPWVFPGRAGGKTGHLVEPKAGWARILKKANEVREKADEPPLGDLRLHDLRRTLGSWMADTGAAVTVIGKTLGHKSPAATAIYARLSLAPVREAKDRAIGALLRAAEGPAAEPAQPAPSKRPARKRMAP